MCLRHQVSLLTLCPLGQPKKAIGQESQIEPWLAHCIPLCLFRFRNRLAPAHSLSLFADAFTTVLAVQVGFAAPIGAPWTAPGRCENPSH